MRILVSLALTVALVAIPGPVLGAKGGKNAPASSIALVLVTDANGDGGPDYADTITFTVSTTATAYPYVNLVCTQGGVEVLYAHAGFYASYLWPDARLMTLASGAWTGGAASCVATLYSIDARRLRETILATLAFDAGT